MRIHLRQGADQPDERDLAAGQSSHVVDVDDPSAAQLAERTLTRPNRSMNSSGGTRRGVVFAKHGQRERTAAAGDLGRRPEARDRVPARCWRGRPSRRERAEHPLVQLDLPARDRVPGAALRRAVSPGSRSRPLARIVGELADGPGHRGRRRLRARGRRRPDHLGQRAAGVGDDTAPAAWASTTIRPNCSTQVRVARLGASRMCARW